MNYSASLWNNGIFLVLVVHTRKRDDSYVVSKEFVSIFGTFQSDRKVTPYSSIKIYLEVDVVWNTFVNINKSS